jgi:two-component system, LytTR family, sensor histidine kinase AlgZ
MKDTQILSTFPESAPGSAPALPAPALVFDACRIGVVLRAVLFVELAIAAVVMFDSHGLLDWLARLSLVTGAALPAVLVWLLLACLAKRVLARLRPSLQYLCAGLLGAGAALYGCGVLALSGLALEPPWLASALSGMLLSAVLVAALVLRAKGRTPANTAARLTELQARIRPHFLFNTLNSAIALVRAEPAKAETLLEDLSDLFRHALMDQGESVTLADEIALARRYLAIEQIRFGERLQVQWRLDPDADGARLPPLLLQPLVENAVRHGVEPSASGAQLHISTQRRGAVVVIKVSNTVPAGPGPAGTGEALRNVRERLALLHDVQGQFRTGSQDGQFQVRMEVPL